MPLSLVCPQTGCYSNYECDIREPGRVVALALVEKTHSAEVDTSTDEAFLDSLFTLYLAGNAQLLLNLSGDVPRPETAELPGRGLRATTVGASTYTINFMDMQGVPNADFYNKIRRSSQNYDLYYFTPSLYWNASAQTITLLASNVIQNDLTQYIGAEGTIKFVSNNDPLPVSFSLVETLLSGLFYEIEGTSAITTTVGVGDTICYSANLNYDFASGSLPSLIWSLDNTAAEIADMGAEIDEVTGCLTYDPTEAGTFTINVKVTNEAGCIFGTLPVVFTVGEAE